MLGILEWKTGRDGCRTVTFQERRILHTRFLCAEIVSGEHTPAAVVRHRVRTAAKGLRMQRVPSVILPANFPFGTLLEESGLSPVSTVPLRQLLASEWAQALLRVQGCPAARTRVLVSAETPGEAVTGAVESLSRFCRYVILDLPSGGDALRQNLWCEYGVALQPVTADASPVDLALYFAPGRAETPPAKIALRLYAETDSLPTLMLPPEMETVLPAALDRAQLLSALVQTGALRRGQIAVGPLFDGGPPLTIGHPASIIQGYDNIE